MGTYFPETYNVMKDQISTKSKIKYLYQKQKIPYIHFAKVIFFSFYHTTLFNYMDACMSGRIIVQNQRNMEKGNLKHC